MLRIARGAVFFLPAAVMERKGTYAVEETGVKREDYPRVPFGEFAEPSREEWYAEANSALKGAPFDKKMYTETYEGILLKPIYNLEDAESFLKLGGFPGEAPFLRGTRSSGYIASPWNVSQGVGEVIPEAAAEAAKRELEHGATVANFGLDECTLLGADPSPEIFTGDYRGLSLTTLRDAETVFSGFDFSKTPVYIYAGASAVPMLGLFGARARAAGERASLASARGCIGADPLGELARRGTLPVPIDELYDEMALAIEWAELNVPGIKTIAIQGAAYHDGGASAVQETAYVVSAAIAYMRALKCRGIEPERVARQIKFSFSVGTNFFMEIARLRAARAVWAQVAEAFGVPPEEAKLDVLARTSRFTETVYDPYVNILRATTQAFSCAVGGADDMQVGCFDGAVRPETEFSMRVARNIQIMLQKEFDMLQPVDPAGGSWYVERLTQQCAAKIWELIQSVDGEGGLYAALKKGSVQDAVGKVFQKRLKNLAFRKDRAVGTNMYPNILEKPLEDTSPKGAELYAARREAIDKFLEVSERRHAAELLANLHEAVNAGGGGFVERVAEAFMSGATIGEVRRALDDGFEGEETARAIGVHRWTEEIEALRRRTEDYMAKTGKTVKIFLANMGPVPQHKARADFSAGFMEVAHFDVIRSDGFSSPEDAAKAAAESGACAAVICSTDDTYPELVPPVALGIKAAAPDMMVFVAGAPAAEYKDSYLDAGVDGFIHVKANCLEILGQIQDIAMGGKEAEAR